MSNPTDQTTAPAVQLQFVATDGGAVAIAFPVVKPDAKVAGTEPASAKTAAIAANEE